MTARNGAPNGAHYDLYIIGVPNGEIPDLSGGNGQQIFVPLGSANYKILLQQGDFAVLDADGTDGQASLQLPKSDATNNGVTEYSVYFRALDKLGGSVDITSCAQDNLGDTYCSQETVSAYGNYNKFQNVTQSLSYIYADINGDGIVNRIELFSDLLNNYYWDSDNSGLKLTQLRFYPGVETTVK